MLRTLLRCHTGPLTRKSLLNPSPQQGQHLFQNSCRNRNFHHTGFLRQRNNSPPSITAFRDTVPPSAGESFAELVGKPGIRKQILFFIGTSLVAYVWASSKTEYDTNQWIKRLTSSSPVWHFQTITNIDLKRIQNAEVIRNLREWYAYIKLRIQNVPELIRPWVSLAVVTVMQPYADASEGKRLCWKICLLNAAVWAAWKVRAWQGPMAIRFMHNSLSGLSYTLITSVFSHRSFLHLLFNCLALESFGSAAYFYLLKEEGKHQPEVLESTSAYHFLSFFVSAGIFSGLVSHVVANKFKYPKMVAELASSRGAVPRTDTWAAALASSTASSKVTAQKIPSEILPSLGASGAIYASVIVTALAFPDSQVALFIPPSYPINIQTGVGALVMLDIVGILRGWRFFDHWAHLGGAAFGGLYYAYGPQFWHFWRQVTKMPESTQKP